MGSADAGWLRRARVTTAVVFFANGFVYASWVPRLAEIRGRLALSEGELGLALLMVAIGAITAMPLDRRPDRAPR